MGFLQSKAINQCSIIDKQTCLAIFAVYLFGHIARGPRPTLSQSDYLLSSRIGLFRRNLG